jgi:uncharacterized protein (TIGR03086 family)
VSRFFKTSVGALVHTGPVTIDDQTTEAHLPEAAATVAALARSLPATDWSAPTPCSDWDFGTLAQHAVGTTTGMSRIGRRDRFDPENLWTGQTVSAADWAQVFAANVEQVAAAWGNAESWRGTVEVGMEMPAATLGDMAYAEILLHGWDLARAAGRDLTISADAAAALHRTIAETAELGRQMGAYGEPVPVSADAPDLQQALGLAGRDPRWTP